ncbi:MAG: sodium:calcium antiporter [Minisyncoccia bacterium]
MIFYILLFIVSAIFLHYSSKLLVESLIKVSRVLSLREFVVAFFVMAFSASLPNLFLGISSALSKIPELSFGDIIGGNVVDLTLVIGLVTLFIKNGIPAESRTVQKTSLFTLISAILPLILVSDGEISRIDGIILILLFFSYIYWLFSKKERFTRPYNGLEIQDSKKIQIFFKNSSFAILGIIISLLSAHGIVISVKYFSDISKVSVGLIGLFIVGLVNCIPETYYAITSAKKGETWMILGDMMGAVIIVATLVLGIVALICPIKIYDFSPYILARIFLIISAIFFYLFLRTDRKLTNKEAIFLLSLYIIFILLESLIIKF